MAFKRFWVVFLYVMISLTSSLALKNLVVAGVDLTIPPDTRPFVTRILDVAGGIEGFEAEVRNAVAEASSLRGGIPASVVDFKISRTIVAKICFIDDICWAAKMREIVPYDRETEYGIGAMMLVENYCPNIPISKFKGYAQRKLLYYFTEWIEGRSLLDEVFGPQAYAQIGETFSIPERIVTSLAEFVYNITTCPIPRKKCKSTYKLFADAVSIIQLDDFSFLGFAARNETELQAMNAITWARRQFVTWHLLKQGTDHSVKPFDGLDKMLLLTWVVRKFSETKDQPFVLHYWDLRLPNILINGVDNIA